MSMRLTLLRGMTMSTRLRLAVLASTFLCLGASEFPEFRMEEFEEAIDKKDYFDESQQEEFEIPAVSDRIYGEEELQRLPIEEIKIEGVIPHPDRQITREKIQQLINEEFQRQQGIGLDENGFTERDMEGAGRYLRELIDRGGRPDQADMDQLMRLMAKQEVERRWITIEQLDAISQVVTDYYRQNGFILATVFIPEQEVKDGIVHLKVLEGRLGEVTVSNNKIYSAETIKSAFSRDLGEVVTDERIEGTLRRINDLPGIRVRGSFSPGKQIGDTSLNLGVLEEKSWKSTILMDNHGADVTGETRLFVTTEWLNIANKGHRLTLAALQSEGPDSSTFGLIEYELPFTNDGRGRLNTSISSNVFSVGNILENQPDVVGETDNYKVSGTYQFRRGRTSNISAELSYIYKEVIFDAPGTGISTDQNMEVVSLMTEFSQLWDEKELLVSGRMGFEQGHMAKGQTDRQSVDFTKILVSANLLKRLTWDNWVTKKESAFNLLIKLNGQYAEENLLPVEQFSLGGPTAVRAFSVSDVSVDAGLYMGFELFFDLPFDPFERLGLPFDVAKPYLFFDYAYGVVRDIDGGFIGDQDTQIKGYGLGMRFNWSDKLTANLIFARPKSTRFEDKFPDADVAGKARVFVDVVYRLN